MTASDARRPRMPEPRLLSRVFAANAVVLIGAATALALTPGEARALVLCAGLAVLLALDFVVLSRVLDPFDRLVAVVRAVDPEQPPARVAIPGAGPDVRRIADALDELLGRLEAERRAGAQRLFAAEDEERRRLSRELHDEVGQLLTVALLQLDQASREPSAAPLEHVAAARATVESVHASVRGLARRLRPQALDDLGLASALRALVAGFDGDADLEPDALTGLTREGELTLYRIAQEACTNAARHAGPGAAVRLTAARATGEVVLTVADAGAGFDPAATTGSGLPGMRERAALAGGRLAVDSALGTGTRVTLHLPSGRSA